MATQRVRTFHGAASCDHSWLTHKDFKFWIKKSKSSKYEAICKLCDKKVINLLTMGKSAVTSHGNWSTHKTKLANYLSLSSLMLESECSKDSSSSSKEKISSSSSKEKDSSSSSKEKISSSSSQEKISSSSSKEKISSSSSKEKISSSSSKEKISSSSSKEKISSSSSKEKISSSSSKEKISSSSSQEKISSSSSKEKISSSSSKEKISSSSSKEKISSSSSQEKISSSSSQEKISSTSSQEFPRIDALGNEINVTQAEIHWVLKLMTAHFSYRSCLKISELFNSMFPESEIAKCFKLSKTKSAYYVVYGLGPYFKEELLQSITIFFSLT